jgi:hypothetical protein
MRYFKTRFFLLILFTTFISQVIFAQTSDQQKKLNELIKIKKELTNNDQLKEFYKIQLYSGNLRDAEDLKTNFDYQFDIPSTIKYESPNYKVWVGNFRTRLEADRAMLTIKEAYENGFIIRPGRN